MPKIIPIRDLKDTAKLSKLIESSDEPIYVTKNGYGCMVLMNMNLFENLSQSNTTMSTDEPARLSIVSENNSEYNK